MERIFKKTLLVIIGGLAAAASTGQARIFTSLSGQIKFRSEAPLELIRAASSELKGLIDISKNTFAFKVSIRSFEGFNSPLQKEHFNENYLESESYPEASFAGKIIEDIDYSKDGIYTVRAKGRLNIHGVEQERIIRCTLEIKEGKLSLKSAFTVLLNDHNIPIPKVVSEKLANEIKVEIDCILQLK
jgi:hypothetical protein